jgi:hypothetical protein
MENEVAFLQNAPSDFSPLPKFGKYHIDEKEAFLIREYIEGELLSEVLDRKGRYDPDVILGDVLCQLISLENVGLYHNDVRVWNTIVMADGHASLIDYGSISKSRSDCYWPQDILLSFWVYVHSVTSGQPPRALPTSLPFISPHSLPNKYKPWAIAAWKYPLSELSFSKLRDLFLAKEGNKLVDEDLYLQNTWMSAIECNLDILGEMTESLKWQFTEIQASNDRNMNEFNSIPIRFLSIDKGLAELSAKISQLEASSSELQQSFEYRVKKTIISIIRRKGIGPFVDLIKRLVSR